MKRCFVLIVAGLVFSCSLSGASTKIVSTWKNPNVSKISLAGKKMAVFLVNADKVLREGPEETMATEIRKYGIDCMAGYTVMPGELARDLDKAKAFIKRIGINDAVLMRVVGDEEKTYYTPDIMWSAPYYQGFWSYWDHSWSTVYTPGYLKTDRIVSIEILFYSVEKDVLVWAGNSETTNPKNVRKFAEDLVKAIAKELRKVGLLAK